MQKTFTREEVVNLLNVLLEQNAPSLMDAITNEHTDFDGEELLILATDTGYPSNPVQRKLHTAIKTAVDILEEQLKVKLGEIVRNADYKLIDNLFEQAKQTEMGAIENAWQDGFETGHFIVNTTGGWNGDGKDYYTKTYKKDYGTKD